MEQSLQRNSKQPNPLNEAKAIAEACGNSFHYKVVKQFKSLGWEVLVSPYYTDSVTDKLREIDIVAEKPFDTNSLMGGGWIGTVNVRLFIECKYINHDATVFWLDARDQDKALTKAAQETSVEQGMLTTPTSTHHHLGNELVAKLFKTGKASNQETEFMFKGLNQSLNALIYYRNTSSIIQETNGRNQKILCTFNYPLIVCNSFEKFFSVDTTEQYAEPKNIERPFQIEVNYISQHNRPEYFLVDVITLADIEPFLSTLIKNDVAIVQTELAWKERYRKRDPDDT